VEKITSTSSSREADVAELNAQKVAEEEELDALADIKMFVLNN
jgi:hypothetical protein